jgi:hypothetical protein
MDRYLCGQRICYGTQYYVQISQSQFDLLKDAYLGDKNLIELLIDMGPVEETNSVTNFFGSMESVYRPFSSNYDNYDNEMIETATNASTKMHQQKTNMCDLLNLVFGPIYQI